ncbi:amidase [Pantoea sp. Mb-10]|uniref:amidase family protein n=1 Tax=unclassified Pantoea TaxID=2630326 RepID=UPI001E39CFEC|nr:MULTISPECIES: amidase family protein [unclassified Pantoea]MCE0491851.1 amidase [Pantoea sp. Mb-10]MCE0503411.1 amidase [Pantoea sp. Pb-8]
MRAEIIRQQFQHGQLDACALAALFARGEITPLAFTEACLAAAQRASAIFITLTPERAREEAAAATLRWQCGAPLSVFDGVPVAWKDLFDVAHTRTTAGSALRQHAPFAGVDAPLVARAARAGMVTLGKTNLSEFAFSGLGLNPTFGTPWLRTPAGSERAPGGSSSGAARAIAEGLVCIALGTDTGGSVRIPAAFSGVVGYRASRGRYEDGGVFPLAASLDTLGPLCRSVRDAQTLDAILCGSAEPPLGAPHFVADTALLDQCDAPVRENGYRALAQLEAAGFRIAYRAVKAMHNALAWIADNGWPGAVEAFQLHADALASPQAEKMDPFVRQRLIDSGRLSPTVLSTFLQHRMQWQRALANELAGAVLITPTVAHTAPLLSPLHDAETFAQTNRATLRLTMPGSLLDMPGVALPSGGADTGLFTSLLFSLPSGEDARLLAAANAAAAVLMPGNPAQCDSVTQP